jgi:hypothetical protein
MAGGQQRRPTATTRSPATAHPAAVNCSEGWLSTSSSGGGVLLLLLVVVVVAVVAVVVVVVVLIP